MLPTLVATHDPLSRVKDDGRARWDYDLRNFSARLWVFFCCLRAKARRPALRE